MEEVERIGPPVVVEALLHYYTHHDPHPRAGAGSVGSAINKLVELGAIEEINPREHEDSEPAWRPYKTTPLGEAWVKAICNTPMPRMAFVDGQGRVIE